MCTIMTLTRKQALLAETLEMIKKDFSSNPHGTTLVLDNNLVVSSLKLNPILHLIRNTKFERLWLHQRYASTSTSGLGGCHNFFTADRKYIIMHNGVVGNHNDYPVDSMKIAALYDVMGDAEIAADTIVATESFANFFMIDVTCEEERDFYSWRNDYRRGSVITGVKKDKDNIPTAPRKLDNYLTGYDGFRDDDELHELDWKDDDYSMQDMRYYVVGRAAQGTLFTDGKGSFSTHALTSSGIVTAVGNHTTSVWES